MIQSKDLMTLEEAAERLPGRTVRWVREKLVGENKVDALNLGPRCVYLYRQSFYDYLERQTTRVESAQDIVRRHATKRFKY